MFLIYYREMHNIVCRDFAHHWCTGTTSRFHIHYIGVRTLREQIHVYMTNYTTNIICDQKKYRIELILYA